MPFGHFIDVTPMLQERGVLDVILQVYNEKKQGFQIRQSLLVFRAEDVTLILGLRCDGDIVSFKNEKDESNFEKKFLHKMHNRHRNAIKDNLLTIVLSKKHKDEQTFVKLLVVYFMTMIMFPNSVLHASLFVARYADNLASLGCYAWAHATHR
ncbi:hypothetical protein IHE45_09G032900 [Dioscorea alata]|uniref:Uncharacterized protein n=1 Tax=Dioscorea alata TaxID=55571 RepID=A0ACB7VE55_DIOAL|nr:hypothetical protein IHE45_09G032900 [Dioscorea alata]